MRLPTGVIGVALSWHALSSGAARGEAGKGFVLLEVAVPSSLNITLSAGGIDGCDHRDGPAQAIGDRRSR
jgi:hypothetical protein